MRNCLTDEDVTKELKDRFQSTQYEISVATIAITLYQHEIMLGGRKKGKIIQVLTNLSTKSKKRMPPS